MPQDFVDAVEHDLLVVNTSTFFFVMALFLRASFPISPSPPAVGGVGQRGRVNRNLDPLAGSDSAPRISPLCFMMISLVINSPSRVRVASAALEPDEFSKKGLAICSQSALSLHSHPRSE